MSATEQGPSQMKPIGDITEPEYYRPRPYPRSPICGDQSNAVLPGGLPRICWLDWGHPSDWHEAENGMRWTHGQSISRQRQGGSLQGTPPTQTPTDEPQEPQTATSDLPAPFSPWSRGFTYGDWPDLRDAVWEGDDSDE